MLGKDAKAYYSSVAIGTTALTDTPADLTWVEITDVQEATVNLDAGEADASTRGTGDFKATETTLLDGSVDFSLKYVPGDTTFDAIQTAFFNKTSIALAFMDGAIATTGKQGFTANFSVTSFGRPEPLEGVIFVPVTVKPASVIAWYEVA